MHEITLDGYAAQCAEQPIRLGTAGSYGVETLSVMRKGEWVDYDIIVAFHPPKGESVQIRLESDNAVSVPAEATAVAGTGEPHVCRIHGRRAADLREPNLSCGSKRGHGGVAPAGPTPDLVQQILSAANEADSKAEQAQKLLKASVMTLMQVNLTVCKALKVTLDPSARSVRKALKVTPALP